MSRIITNHFTQRSIYAGVLTVSGIGKTAPRHMSRLDIKKSKYAVPEDKKIQEKAEKETSKPTEKGLFAKYLYSKSDDEAASLQKELEIQERINKLLADYQDRLKDCKALEETIRDELRAERERTESLKKLLEAKAGDWDSTDSDDSDRERSDRKTSDSEKSQVKEVLPVSPVPEKLETQVVIPKEDLIFFRKKLAWIAYMVTTCALMHLTLTTLIIYAATSKDTFE